MDGLKLSDDLENWMGKLPDALRNVAVIHLAIPGSHDSGTSSITKHSELAPDAEPIVKKLGACLGPVLTSIMSKWAKTQTYEVCSQLKAGIRFFDLRTATRPGDELHIVHGMYAESIREVLQEMNSFLDAHSKEVVILDFQHFYDMNSVDHFKLMDMIDQIFGGKIVPRGNYKMDHLTLNYLSQHGYQVIVVYRNSIAVPRRYFPGDCYPTPWPNTTKTNKLLEILTDNLKTRQNNYGYVSQFILTPTGYSIMSHIWGSLKSFSAVPLYKTKFHWVTEQRPGVGGVNVILGDFVDFEECKFSAAIIDLNIKILGTDGYPEGPVKGTFIQVEPSTLKS